MEQEFDKQRNNPEQTTLRPPRIRWLGPSDTLNGEVNATIADVRITPSTKYKDAVDTDILLELRGGQKRWFSVWGNNYDALYERTGGNSPVGVACKVVFTTEERDGKTVLVKTLRF